MGSILASDHGQSLSAAVEILPPEVKISKAVWGVDIISITPSFVDHQN